MYRYIHFLKSNCLFSQLLIILFHETELNAKGGRLCFKYRASGGLCYSMLLGALVLGMCCCFTGSCKLPLHVGKWQKKLKIKIKLKKLKLIGTREMFRYSATGNNWRK